MTDNRFTEFHSQECNVLTNILEKSTLKFISQPIFQYKISGCCLSPRYNLPSHSPFCPPSFLQEALETASCNCAGGSTKKLERQEVETGVRQSNCTQLVLDWEEATWEGRCAVRTMIFLKRPLHDQDQDQDQENSKGGANRQPLI